MKKITALFCLLSAVALAAVWQAPAFTAMAAGQPALAEPPSLMVSCGKQDVQLWRGSYNWNWKSGEEMQGTIACGVGPLDALKDLPELNVKPGDQLTFYAFPQPDELSVWAYYVPETTDSAFVEVVEIPLDGGTVMTVPADGTGVAYEVHGVWTSTEDYSGNAWYAFYIP